MLNCPKCGEELTYLRNYCKAEMVYEFGLNADGEFEYEYVDTIDTGVDAEEYECPNCNTILAYSEEEAMAILKGEITSKMAERFARIAFEGK